MLISFPAIDRLTPEVLGALLSLSAGALVYVGASHLLPHAEREPPPHGFAAFAGGILLAIAIVLGHRG